MEIKCNYKNTKSKKAAEKEREYLKSRTKVYVNPTILNYIKYNILKKNWKDRISQIGYESKT